MNRVIEVGKKGNWKKRQSVMSQAEAINSRVEIIQALIPLGLRAVEDALQYEVEELAGSRYSRYGKVPGNVRWAKQKTFVYLGDCKMPIRAPRVRNRYRNEEVGLETLARMHQPQELDEKLFRKVIGGLSCRDYEDCAVTTPRAFGLSGSTVSRRYIKATSRKLKEFMERRLAGYEFVALFMDGKTFADDEIVIAVGITLQGDKVILGFVQTGTENEGVCSDFLRGLVKRGFSYEQGLFVVIDGAKGIRSAIEKVFGEKAVVQRCQWHKRENVVKYLPKALQPEMRRKLQGAYENENYRDAKSELLKIRTELEKINKSAANSLEEGFEETLTLHKLGLFKELSSSFKTANIVESIQSQLEQRTGKVDYWKNSDQKQRWVAAALLEIEKRLIKVKGHVHLPRLMEALKAEITGKSTEERRAA
jgi:transposase-like protein